MKRFALLAAAAFVLAGCAQTPPPASPGAQAYYDKSVAKGLPTPEPLPGLAPLPKGAKVLIVGDSFVQGHAAIPPEAKGYAPLLAELQGWDVTVDGVGMTGFTSGGDGGRLTYARRIAAQPADLNPDLVFMQGSQNDYKAKRPEIIDATTATIKLVKERWPDAQIVIMGPAAPMPKGPSLEPLVSAFSRASFNEKVPYINPLEEVWFTTENSPKYAHTDGWHLNTAGHAFLASKVKETLDARTKR